MLDHRGETNKSMNVITCPVPQFEQSFGALLKIVDDLLILSSHIRALRKSAVAKLINNWGHVAVLQFYMGDRTCPTIVPIRLLILGLSMIRTRTSPAGYWRFKKCWSRLPEYPLHWQCLFSSVVWLLVLMGTFGVDHTPRVASDKGWSCNNLDWIFFFDLSSRLWYHLRPLGSPRPDQWARVCADARDVTGALETLDMTDNFDTRLLTTNIHAPFIEQSNFEQQYVSRRACPWLSRPHRSR